MRSSAWIPPFFPIRKNFSSKGSPGRFEGENRTKQFFSSLTFSPGALKKDAFVFLEHFDCSIFANKLDSQEVFAPKINILKGGISEEFNSVA